MVSESTISAKIVLFKVRNGSLQQYVVIVICLHQDIAGSFVLHDIIVVICVHQCHLVIRGFITIHHGRCSNRRDVQGSIRRLQRRTYIRRVIGKKESRYLYIRGIRINFRTSLRRHNITIIFNRSLISLRRRFMRPRVISHSLHRRVVRRGVRRLGLHSLVFICCRSGIGESDRCHCHTSCTMSMRDSGCRIGIRVIVIRRGGSGGVCRTCGVRCRIFVISRSGICVRP
mmetsp:Transcript_64931/g.76848  ORF Transcript_64931/g.76848 Transcript_64931/m.76848 type:complete len:229 (-) Transcript_64931:1059-1745(-)